MTERQERIEREKAESEAKLVPEEPMVEPIVEESIPDEHTEALMEAVVEAVVEVIEELEPEPEPVVEDLDRINLISEVDLIYKSLLTKLKILMEMK